MNILALETTDVTGSVAASVGPDVLLELALAPDQRSAQSLAPALKSLLAQVGWRAADVELVAVTVGPGSFTGLRVGVTTAKTFAYAAGAEILGVDTLQTIAANFGHAGATGSASAAAGAGAIAGLPSSAEVPESPPLLDKPAVAPDVSQLEILIDAQRGEVVIGTFARSADGWFRPTGPQRLLPIDRWLAELRPDVAVAGPVLKRLQSRVPAGTIIVEERLWHPRAAAVARLAARDHAAGRRDNLWTLLPRYSRRPAAEEKLEAK